MNAVQRTEQDVVHVEEAYPQVTSTVTLEDESFSENEFLDFILEENTFEILMDEFIRAKCSLFEFYGRPCWSLSSSELERLMQGLFRLQELLEELKYTNVSLSIIEKYSLDFQIVLCNLDLEGIM